MINKDTVKYVAGLARISITEEQKDCLGNQLSKIIDYIDKLKETDTNGVEPLRGLYAQRNAFRQDEVQKSSSKENILDNSPAREGDYFKVPKIIE